MATSFASFVNSILCFSPESNTDMNAVSAFMDTYNSIQNELFMLDLPGNKINVVHNPLLLSADDICQALRSNLLFHATKQEDGGASKKWEFPIVTEEEIEVVKTAKYPRVTVILSGICWTILLFSFIGGNWDYLQYVSLLALAFGLPPIAFNAYKTLCRFKFDTNVLILSAALGATALEEYTEAGAVAFLFSLL